MKNFTKMCLMLAAWGGVLMPLARGAGFDCKKAAAPMELAICGDKTLSEADEQLNDGYTYLLAECANLALHARLRATQRHWLAAIRKQFGAGGDKAVEELKAAYRARNASLGKLLTQCNPGHGAAYAIVTKVPDRSNNNEVLFVQSSPPQAGWRINRVLFNDYNGPPPPYIGGLKKFFATHGPASEGSGFYTHEVVLNQGKLLVVNYSGLYYEEGFPRAYPSEGREIFDTRTGREVKFKELFADLNDSGFRQYLKTKLLALVKARVAAAKLKGCTYYGGKGQPGFTPEFLQDGRIRFPDFGCTIIPPTVPTKHGAGLSVLNPAVTPSEIRRFLSPYGKSLLLGEGDVRAPAH